MDRLQTVKDVAQRFEVSVETVRTWVRGERIPCIRVTRRIVRFNMADVERALQKPATNKRQAS